jgi:hypothetical protein
MADQPRRDRHRLSRIINRKFDKAKQEYQDELADLDQLDDYVDDPDDKVLFKRGYMAYVRGTPREQLSEDDRIDLDDGHPPFTFFKRGYLAAEEEGEQNIDESDDSGNESHARGGYAGKQMRNGMMKQGASRKFGKNF